MQSISRDVAVLRTMSAIHADWTNNGINNIFLCVVPSQGCRHGEGGLGGGAGAPNNFSDFMIKKYTFKIL